ncbi:hypothetical protein [Streptomyces sp. NPDC001530]|uniref:hypothetical protein n=1 Tax=Streptomyces sp. NPDC001530 TaxID=3364582 RepID=UPI0036D1ACE1
MAQLPDKGWLGEGDSADLGVVGTGDVGPDVVDEFGDDQGSGGAVTAHEGGFEVVAHEVGAPVVGVVVLAAVGVFEEEAVLGDVVPDSGGEAPPEAGAVAVAGQVEQAGEDEGSGLVGVLAGDEVGEVAVGVRVCGFSK